MSETANQPADATAGAEPDAIPPDPANPAPTAGPLLPAWAESRISTITRKYRDEERARALAEAKMAELQGRLDAIGLGSPQANPQGVGAGTTGSANPPGDIESQIQTRAAALAETARFTEQCNDIARKGGAAFADFGEVIKNYGTYLGGLPNSIIEGALETDDPHITIYELGKDMAEATRIAGLSPARQAAAVARFAGKLAKSAPVAGNALAAAVGGTGAAPAALPPPIQAKVGSANNGTGRQGAVRLDDEKVSMEDWIKTRNESMKRR